MTSNSEEVLKVLDAASRLDEIKAQSALLSAPSYLQKMSEQMTSLAAPSYWEQMRKQVDAITNPSYFAEMRKQMEAFAIPLYLKQMPAQLAGMGDLSHIADMRRQLEAVANLPYLNQMSEQLAELENPSYLKQLREQMAAMAKPSYFTALHDQLSTLGNSARMQAQLSAVVGSYNELLSTSVLAKLLASAGTPGTIARKVSEVEIFERIDIGYSVFLDIVPSDPLDREILAALETNDTTRLSSSAIQRLQSFYFSFVFVWETLLRVVETYSAYLILSALMSGVSTPADVPKQAELLANHERLTLADYRIVNRNGARLRAAPSTSSQALLSLPLGTPVELMEKSTEGWFRVLVENQGAEIEGWIYVSVTTPIPAPRSPRELARESGMK